MKCKHLSHSLHENLQTFMITGKGYELFELLSEFPDIITVSKNNSKYYNTREELLQHGQMFHNIYVLADNKNSVLIKLACGI